MLESTGSSKPRDALLEKLRERIKDRDRALEVKHKHTHIQIYTIDRKEWQLDRNSEKTPKNPLYRKLPFSNTVPC